MTAAVLQRETLQTFRVLDFCSERELGTQFGDLAAFGGRISHEHYRHRHRSSGAPQPHPRA